MYYTTTFTVFYPLHQRKKPFPRHICVGAMAICSFRTSTSSSTGPLRELLPLVRKSPVGVISLIPIRGIEVVLTNRAEENGWNDPYPTSFWHRWRHRWESSHHGTNLTWHFTKSHGCRLCSYGSPEVEGFFPTKKKLQNQYVKRIVGETHYVLRVSTRFHQGHQWYTLMMWLQPYIYR